MKLPLALLLILAAAPLSADVLVVADGTVEVRPASIELPRRGSSMAAVEARFGAPRARHAAIGQPPITRWDYENFSVYFEYQHVVHAVEAAAPAPAPAG
ncbi:MAG: phosphodiesterase [Steroidobacteraceae bacterium]